jgi:serine/threonine-protein kinase
MLVGQTIGSPAKGEFHIDKELGSGAMGTVYRATLTLKGKKLPVALKVVSLGLLGNESAMARFDRESAILQQLRHPHIVRLYGTGRFRGTPYIAMEFVDGEPLDRALARRGRLGWEEVLEYARQLCDALHHAHEKGIIHRDLKPSNLMITTDGRLKLTDFGIAKDTDVTALTAANNTIGTAAYMSPEQCRGSRDLTPRSDLYSLGVVMYELVTGKKPFYADNSMEMFLKHVNEAPVRPGKLVPDLPVWVDNLIMHLMEKSIDTRPLDAATVGKMIQGITDKVRQHKSAGLEVATARKIDRKLNAAAEVTAEDREAARAMKGKKRRKKKAEAVPLLQRTWVKAAGIAAALAALIGVGVWLSLPPGVNEAFEPVAAAGPVRDKVDALRTFLRDHGGKAHPKVDEARALFRKLRTQLAEEQLTNRYGSDDPTKPNRRKAQDGEPQEVMDKIWAAMEAERAGKRKEAEANWQFVRKEVPDADPAQYADEDATRVPAYRWVAEKRVGELEAAGREVARLTAAAAGGYDDTDPPKFADKTAEGKAVHAFRLQRVKDPAKAHKVWADLAAATSADPAQRVLHLLAVEQRVATAPEKGKEEETRRNRAAVVDQLLDAVHKRWAPAKADDKDLKTWRDVREDCRLLIDLYADEADEGVRKAVGAARELLKEATPR